jgi:6-phosphofructokinase 2
VIFFTLMADILTVTMNPALDVSAGTRQVHPTSKLRCDSVQRHAGGGGVNVARVVHRLGGDCAALCMVGGPSGEMLTTLLQAEGVACLPVAIAGHTRESFTVLDRTTNEEFRFVLPGPDIHSDEMTACLGMLAWQPPPDFVVASGSLPPGVPDDFYRQLAQMSNAWAAKFIVDGTGESLRAALEHGVYMVKPSLREFREITQLPLHSVAEVAHAASQWVARQWAQVVVVSLGEYGALMAHADGVVFAPALPVTVVSAVGAGDSFVAGIVWSLSRNDPLEKAFRYGVASASASLMSAGGGLCSPDDVQTWFGQVVCTDHMPETPL